MDKLPLVCGPRPRSNSLTQQNLLVYHDYKFHRKFVLDNSSECTVDKSILAYQMLVQQRTTAWRVLSVYVIKIISIAFNTSFTMVYYVFSSDYCDS